MNSVSSSILDMADVHVAVAPSSEYVSKETIAVKPLSLVLPELNQERKKCHLKIDTQGYERFVVEGASGIWEMVESIEMEVSLLEMYEGGWLFDEAVVRMSELGFGVYNVFPFFSNRDSGRVYQMDVIFTRKK